MHTVFNISHLRNGSCKNKKERKEKQQPHFTYFIACRAEETDHESSQFTSKVPQALKQQARWGLWLEWDWDREGQKHLSTCSLAVSSKQLMSLSFFLNQVELIGLTLPSLTMLPSPSVPTR